MEDKGNSQDTGKSGTYFHRGYRDVAIKGKEKDEGTKWALIF